MLYNSNIKIEIYNAMEVNMKNKLAYLGFLGVIGIFGLWSQSLSLGSFLLFFFFFSYAKMPADELFRANVQKAGLQALWTGLVVDVTIILYYSYQATFVHRFAPEELTPFFDSTAQGLRDITISRAFFGHIYAVSVGLILSFVITISVFIISLFLIDRKERKLLRDNND